MVLGAINVVLVTKNAVPGKGKKKSAVSGLHVLFMVLGLQGAYQMDMPGLGTWGSFTVPEKRLSRWGS